MNGRLLLLALAVLLTCGCASARRRKADEDYMTCIQYALRPSMTDAEMSDIAQGCAAVWAMRTSK